MGIVEKSKENFTTKFDQRVNNENMEKEHFSNTAPTLQNIFHKDFCIISIKDDNFHEIQNQFPKHGSENISSHKSDLYKPYDNSFVNTNIEGCDNALNLKLPCELSILAHSFGFHILSIQSKGSMLYRRIKFLLK